MAPPDFSPILPAWPAPPGVRALCTTRTGGISVGPYQSLNLGDHVGDEPDCVAANRARVSGALSTRAVFLRQVHGQHVATLDLQTPDGIEADACITDAAGVACTIMVADCLPLLLTADDGRIVGAAHAGWRGLAGQGGGGVIEAIVDVMTAKGAVEASRLLVWLGPCIGPGQFEVGDDVKSAFVRHDSAAARCFRAVNPGKWLADLQGLARQRLAALGIARVFGNDGSREWCTASNPSRFFSHRRDRVSGRFAAAICITA